MKIDLTVKIKDLTLPTPVIAASGTFGNGEEYADLIDLSKLGGICLKGTTLQPRNGNAYSRIIETPSGILNCIGLQNPGLEVTLKEKVPFVKKYGIPAIINISGATSKEYAEMAAIIDNDQNADAIELNFSCPNVEHGGIAFGTDAILIEKTVAMVRAATTKPIIVKLSPNVADITIMAKAAEGGGADALSVINTLIGMVIDIDKQKPSLSNCFGGLSGPAIRPVALRMVWQVCRAVKIPVIGLGGIETATDAIQFFMAGASAIQVGTATFYNPNAMIEITNGIVDFMQEKNIQKLTDLTI